MLSTFSQSPVGQMSQMSCFPWPIVQYSYKSLCTIKQRKAADLPMREAGLRESFFFIKLLDGIQPQGYTLRGTQSRSATDDYFLLIIWFIILPLKPQKTVENVHSPVPKSKVPTSNVLNLQPERERQQIFMLVKLGPKNVCLFLVRN